MHIIAVAVQKSCETFTVVCLEHRNDQLNVKNLEMLTELSEILKLRSVLKFITSFGTAQTRQRIPYTHRKVKSKSLYTFILNKTDTGISIIAQADVDRFLKIFTAICQIKLCSIHHKNVHVAINMLLHYLVKLEHQNRSNENVGVHGECRRMQNVGVERDVLWKTIRPCCEFYVVSHADCLYTGISSGPNDQ